MAMRKPWLRMCLKNNVQMLKFPITTKSFGVRFILFMFRQILIISLPWALISGFMCDWNLMGMFYLSVPVFIWFDLLFSLWKNRYILLMITKSDDTIIIHYQKYNRVYQKKYAIQKVKIRPFEDPQLGSGCHIMIVGKEVYTQYITPFWNVENRDSLEQFISDCKN
jgi:hypothetical protein